MPYKPYRVKFEKRKKLKYRCIIKARQFYQTFDGKPNGDWRLPHRWLKELIGDEAFKKLDIHWGQCSELYLQTNDAEVIVKLALTPREIWKQYRVTHPFWKDKGITWLQERKD